MIFHLIPLSLLKTLLFLIFKSILYLAFLITYSFLISPTLLPFDPLLISSCPTSPLIFPALINPSPTFLFLHPTICYLLIFPLLSFQLLASSSYPTPFSSKNPSLLPHLYSPTLSYSPIYHLLSILSPFFLLLTYSFLISSPLFPFALLLIFFLLLPHLYSSLLHSLLSYPHFSSLSCLPIHHMIFHY